MKKISHSAFRKYMVCPRMYDLHYNKRLRPTGTSSALLFGSAMDEGLNAMLMKSGVPLQIFQDNFTWEMCQDIEWHKDDYDENIFTKEQLTQLQSHEWNYRNWASLRIKGRMLLESYEAQILPNINKVYSVQRELEGRRGFIDAIVDYEGHGKVLLDHKTASRPYFPDAINNDSQLSLYAYHEGIEKVGFIVLNKKINQNLVKKCSKCGFNGSYTRYKTCPEIKNGTRCHGKWTETRSPTTNIQVLIQPVPKEWQKHTIDAVYQVEKAISSGHYPPNLNSCNKYFGKPCPYKDFCLHKKKNGLEYKPEEKEKK